MSEKTYKSYALKVTPTPDDAESQRVDQAVLNKMDKLEKIGDPEATYKWRGIAVPGDTSGTKINTIRHSLLTQIARTIGVEAFEAQPAPLLEQVAFTSVMEEHDIESLFSGIVQDALIAYAYPETSQDAFQGLVNLKAMSQYAMGDFEKSVDGRCPGCGEFHDDDEASDDSAPTSDVTVH